MAELHLVVQDLKGRRHDVGVLGPASTTVGQLIEAVAVHLDVPIDHGSPWAARLERTGRRLDREAIAARVDLRHGDELRLERASGGPAGPSDPGPAAARVLTVVGGPGLGKRYRLGEGEHHIGRDPGGDVVLEDPSTSTRHATLVIAPGESRLTDLGSRNGTTIDGVAVRPSQPSKVPAGAIIRIGRTLLRLDRPGSVARTVVARDGIIEFNRPPRRSTASGPLRFEVPAPPDDPAKIRLPLSASLIPLVFAGVLAVLIPSQGTTLLLFAALTPVLAVASYVEDRRSGRKEFGGKVVAWRSDLEAMQARANDARNGEIAERRAAAPDIASLHDRANLQEDGLWERRPEDPDFLVLRAGVADQPSVVTIELADGGSPSVRAEAGAVTKPTRVPAVPLVAPLAGLGAIGLCGSPERVDGLARSLVLQVAALHSPRQVLISAALSEARASEWAWLKWLPHVHPDVSLLGGSQVAAGPAAAGLVQRLLDLIGSRRSESQAVSFGSDRAQALPIVVVLLDESISVSRPLLARLLREGPTQGVLGIWLGSDLQNLPGECRAIAELQPTVAAMTWTDIASHEVIGDVIPDGVPPVVAEELARALAPLSDVAADRGTAAIPTSVGLLELLGTSQPDGAWVASRWQQSRTDVIAPVGATASGRWSIDLLRDGPHGLIAGMTGAGKSELLQTLVGSLAATLPPARLTYLLIDYKGGAAFRECVALPHTVGFVTDLDAHLTNRALTSLNAELRHREELFRAAGAKDLPTMIRSHSDEAPPRLVIVVDEFATLAKEVPDFVEGLVDVAQRGRSLGVHMLLATQRPAGVVTANIRANTNLRIALRVSDTADSDDVIGVADAARIARDLPGRAFARTGHSELIEFQAGYAGRRVASATSGAAVQVYDLDIAGDPIVPLGGGPRQTSGVEVSTELQVLVAAIEQAAEQLAVPAPRRPWLPALPTLLSLELLPQAASPDAPIAMLGLIDEPAAQDQRPLTFDLEKDGSLLIFGSAGSGKTTLLRTLAASFARSGGAAGPWMYGLDFGTRGLAPLASLPSCGGVIQGEDEERVQRLIATVRREIVRRKDLFGRRNVSSLQEWTAIPDVDVLPRIVVLLDDYEGFGATYERVGFGELIDLLPRLVSDGRATGIHFAISAERRGSIPTALFASIPTRLVLRMSDEDEYASFGLPWRTLKDAKLPPGRGFTATSLEVQIAVPGADGSAAGQVAAIAGLAALASGVAPLPPMIGLLPPVVPVASLPIAAAWAATIGIGDEELEPVEVDLRNGHVLVAGPLRSGRSTALATIARAIQASTPGAALHLLAPRRSPLTELDLWASVAKGVEACDERIAALTEELGDMDESGPPVVIVIDDGEGLAETDSATTLEELASSGRERNLRLVVAVEAKAAQRAYAGWLTQVRGSEQGVLLDPDPDVDGDLLSARLPRGSGKSMPPGRGYLVRRGQVELMQMAGD